ncbi:hypothetical protein LUZ63_009053 [Rhynchospora breviuscula]|uniref:Reverse transcriptase zinc-binding domain-containing protein n=1 Tax=Rhynchospora breviuscula TaxID=2022672 RepID=A0A9Q0HNT1_9POAL|nr:hypothetical protein LUZ63_009053 [Rhynchospora breviuscula]
MGFLMNSSKFIGNFSNLFNCEVSNLPLNYLGLPLTQHRPGRQEFQPLIDKMQSKLEGWKSALLSRAGRLVLANAVLSSIPVFYMSVFRLPKWVIKEIDKIRRQFIWGRNISSNNPSGRGMPLLAWDRVCLPKKAGGFGIINLRMHNVTLLLRWWWKNYHDPESQWAKITKNLYGKRDSNIPPIGWKKEGSFFWKDLMALRFYFQISTVTNVLSGKQTLFWFDNWASQRLCYFGAENEISARRCITLCDALPIWKQLPPAPHTLKNFMVAEIASQFQLTQGNDHLIWRWNANGNYTASSVYRTLILAGKTTFPLKNIWKLKVTPSIKCFLILLAHGRILTQDSLQRRGIAFEENCVLCDQQLLETPSHLFFSCPISNEIWRYLSNRTGFNLPQMNDSCINILVKLFQSAGTDSFHSTIIATACWAIWLERNNRCFRGEFRGTSAVQDWIVSEATFF